MRDINWGLISTGPTFESLATTILFFEDRDCKIFGRPGKDGGQDAISADGSVVFQAKHHSSGNASLAIRDARNEAKKIHTYRQAGHERYDQWRKVKKWQLITNVAFNPTDDEEWQTKVMPNFKELGIDASYWSKSNLESLLTKHPEIRRAYFENETRALLSVNEITSELPKREPFLRRWGSFFGRKEEKSNFECFLKSDYTFLIIHGGGGIGKTRFLLETGADVFSEGHWQVLWANTESMLASSSWFDGIIPERQTLLLVDEPENVDLLKILLEQIGTVGRACKWKAAITARSTKEPVLGFLRQARVRPRVAELELPCTDPDTAQQICLDLIEKGELNSLPPLTKLDITKIIVLNFGTHPIWMTLAIKHLEKNKNFSNIPIDAKILAEEYISETTSGTHGFSIESTRAILNWISLIEPMNIEDERYIAFLSGKCASTTEECARLIEKLIANHTLDARGARRRLIRMKSKTLREHILIEWIASTKKTSKSKVGSTARKLIDDLIDSIFNGNFSNVYIPALASLAEIDYIISQTGQESQILNYFFLIIQEKITDMSTSNRLTLIDYLIKIAQYNPKEITSLSKKIRENPSASEELTGFISPKKLSNDDVIAKLPWMLFSAASNATKPEEQEEILLELGEITKIEYDLSLRTPLKRDGKRARDLVEKIVQGSPQFASDFTESASRICLELLSNLIEEPSHLEIAALHAFIKPVLKTERRQSWAEGRSIKIRNFTIERDGAAWIERDKILFKIRDLLDSEKTPKKSRVLLWKLYEPCRGEDDLHTLHWIHACLERLNTGIEEFLVARPHWEWHLAHQKNPEIKYAAARLESCFMKNEIAKECALISGKLQDPETFNKNIALKAEQLANTDSASAISDFINRTSPFFLGSNNYNQLQLIASHMGRHAIQSNSIKRFVEFELKKNSIDNISEFAISISASWVNAVRRTDPASAGTVTKDLLTWSNNNKETQIALVERIYRGFPFAENPTESEVDILISRISDFMNHDKPEVIVGALALFLPGNGRELCKEIEKIIHESSMEKLPKAITALVFALHWAIKDANSTQRAQVDPCWLLSNLFLISGVTGISSMTDYYIKEILNEIGRPSISWFAEQLHTRHQLETENADSDILAVSSDARISRYIEPVKPLNCPETRKAISQLVDFSHKRGSISRNLPKILRDIDPEGLLTPDAVVEHINSTTNTKYIIALSRICQTYTTNSDPWRKIAIASIQRIRKLNRSEEALLYSSMENDIVTYSSRIGEVASIFIDSVNEARRHLDEESEETLKKFWKQRLERAEEDLRSEEERSKEDRGE